MLEKHAYHFYLLELIGHMVADEIEDDPIDLDGYPDNTDLVIAALHTADTKLVNDKTIDGLTLKQIADKTSLTKSQVRTRIKELVANGHLEEQVPYSDRTRPAVYYEMRKQAKITATVLNLDEKTLAKIPKEPTQQDIIDVLGKIAINENKMTDISVELGSYEHVVLDE